MLPEVEEHFARLTSSSAHSQPNRELLACHTLAPSFSVSPLRRDSVLTCGRGIDLAKLGDKGTDRRRCVQGGTRLQVELERARAMSTRDAEVEPCGEEGQSQPRAALRQGSEPDR